MTEMILEVYDPSDLVTPKATLDPGAGTRIWDPKFRQPAKGFGSGSFALQNDDDDIANIAEGDLIRCVKNSSPVFEWQVKSKNRVSVDKAAAAGLPSGLKFTEIAGIDTKAYGSRSPIRALRGGRSIPKETIRPFDWTSPLYDFTVSPWTAATEIIRVDSLVSAHWIGSPQFYPDKEIFWIAGADGDDGDATDGVRLFRAPRFTITTYDMLVGFFAWIDNEGIVYLNGTEILRCDTFHECRYIDLLLTPGDYDLAVFCRNYVPTPTSTGTNPTGIGVGVYERTSDGTFVSRVMVSDSSWKVNVKPATTPGMPGGAPLRILLAEAQARGEMPGVTLGFTDTLDSAGNALPTATDLGVVVGETFSDYLAALEDATFDVVMDPGLVLQIYYPKGSRGTATAVTFTDGVSLKKLNHQEQDDRITALLIDYDGGYVEVGSGEFCKALKLTQIASEDAAIRIGTELLVGRNVPSIRYAAEIHTGTGREPYDDFLPGDTVNVDDPDGTPGPVPVAALTWTWDRAARSVWAAEFGDLIEPIETIAERAVRRFAGTRSAMNVNLATTGVNGDPALRGAGGQIYHQEKLDFTYEPSDLVVVSQKTPAPVTRDVAFFEVELDEADTEAHVFTVKVNGSTLTSLTTTIAIGATFGRSWADIGEFRIISPTDKVTLEFSGAPIRFVAKLVLR